MNLRVTPGKDDKPCRHRWSKTGRCVCPGCGATRDPGALLKPTETIHSVAQQHRHLDSANQQHRSRREALAAQLEDKLNTREVAALLRTTTEQVRLFGHTGHLSMTKVGKYWAFDPWEVNEMRNQLLVYRRMLAVTPQLGIRERAQLRNSQARSVIAEWLAEREGIVALNDATKNELMHQADELLDLLTSIPLQKGPTTA